jgi:hypothetical protein
MDKNQKTSNPLSTPEGPPRGPPRGPAARGDPVPTPRGSYKTTSS